MEKPVIPEEPIVSSEPPAASLKQSRRVWSRGRWCDGAIYEMDMLEAGNVIQGLAVVEAPSTTLVVPEGQSAVLDQHRIFHVS